MGGGNRLQLGLVHKLTCSQALLKCLETESLLYMRLCLLPYIYIFINMFTSCLSTLIIISYCGLRTTHHRHTRMSRLAAAEQLLLSELWHAEQLAACHGFGSRKGGSWSRPCLQTQ